MDYTNTWSSPLGTLTMASDGEALTGLWFAGQRHFGDTLGQETVEAELPVFAQTVRWLELYFGGQVPDFTPALCLRGTAFRRRIWDLLLQIPYGQTTTYGALAGLSAKQPGAGQLARAVGGAVARNPVSLIVPCHRVLAADGSLTGYAAGLERKAALLELEKTHRIVRDERGWTWASAPTIPPLTNRKDRRP